jgi:hypothetical protein
MCDCLKPPNPGRDTSNTWSTSDICKPGISRLHKELGYAIIIVDGENESCQITILNRDDDIALCCYLIESHIAQFVIEAFINGQLEINQWRRNYD